MVGDLELPAACRLEILMVSSEGQPNIERLWRLLGASMEILLPTSSHLLINL